VGHASGTIIPSYAKLVEIDHVVGQRPGRCGLAETAVRAVAVVVLLALKNEVLAALDAGQREMLYNLLRQATNGETSCRENLGDD
jgi:hypothetical protein